MGDLEGRRCWWETQSAGGAGRWVLQPGDQPPQVLAASLLGLQLRGRETSSHHSVGLRVSEEGVGISLV